MHVCCVCAQLYVNLSVNKTRFAGNAVFSCLIDENCRWSFSID